jgi:hypothetical protein
MPVCTFVWPHGTTRLPLDRFSWYLIWGFFENRRENSSFIKIWQEKSGTLHKYQHTFMIIAHFFLDWEMFRTEFVEKIKPYILCPITFFRKSSRLWDNVEKYIRARQATDDNMARALVMPGNYGYTNKHTHTQNVCHLLLFHCNNGCTNAPRCYVIRTLPVLFKLVMDR